MFAGGTACSVVRDCPDGGLVGAFLPDWHLPEEGVVLDPFLGSGTTAISALRSGRSAIGIELNPKYCAEAEQRILAEFSRSEVASSTA